MREAVRRAAAAVAALHEPLVLAEEPFELVRGRRNAGVVEADEEVGAVALEDLDEVVDEVAGGRAETCPGSVRLEVGEKRVEASLCLGRVGRPIGPTGARREGMGNVPEDSDVALDATGDTGAMPVRLERLREFVKERSGQACDGFWSPPLA